MLLESLSSVNVKAFEKHLQSIRETNVYVAYGCVRMCELTDSYKYAMLNYYSTFDYYFLIKKMMLEICG